jgi:hypothetical protein
MLIGLASATVSAVPGTVSRLPRLCHSTAYRPGVRVMLNGSPVSLGCKIRYALPGSASANPVSLTSVRGSIVVSLIRSAKLRAAPMACRAGSKESKDGFPSDGFAGTPPLRMPRSYKIGL